MRLAASTVTAAAIVAAVTAAASQATPAGPPPGKTQATTVPAKANGNGNGGSPPATPGKGNGDGHGHGSPSSGSTEGIVQSVSASGLVLRQLDGSEVRIAVTAKTRVFVDGRRSGIRGVRPGFVVSAAWTAGKARVLQTFDPSSSAVEVGVVHAVTAHTIVVRRNNGGTVTIRIGGSTRLLLDGSATTLSAVRAGYTVVFTAADASRGKPAVELRFLRPV